MFTQVQTVSKPEANGDVPAQLLENVKQSIIVAFDKICGTAVMDAPERSGAGSDGIVGIISFVGDLNLSLMLGFTPESAVQLAQKFAGFEIPFDSPDMGDVIGEMTNVLAGVINGGLETISIKTHISFPTVARGSDVELLLPENLLSQMMNFVVMDLPFWVKLVVAKRN